MTCIVKADAPSSSFREPSLAAVLAPALSAGASLAPPSGAEWHATDHARPGGSSAIASLAALGSCLSCAAGSAGAHPERQRPLSLTLPVATLLRLLGAWPFVVEPLQINALSWQHPASFFLRTHSLRMEQSHSQPGGGSSAHLPRALLSFMSFPPLCKISNNFSLHIAHVGSAGHPWLGHSTRLHAQSPAWPCLAEWVTNFPSPAVTSDAIVATSGVWTNTTLLG